MVLAKYFFKRFFKYLFITNISLTLLFNFIEFFEKLIRVKHATITMILEFILLYIPPSFFDTLPLSCWLATCLLIKELVQQNEWQILKILNVNINQIFKLFLLIGITSATFSFVGKELLTLNLLNKAEQFRLEKFKQRSTQKILNKWIILSDENSFCHIGYLNLKNNTGKDLTLIYMSPTFEIDKIITSKNFKVDTKNQTLLLLDKNNETISVPTLFPQLKLNNTVPTINFLIKNVVLNKSLLPQNVWNDLLLQLLKRLFIHIQVLFYPILTFCLFFLLPFNSRKNWLLMLLPYPLLTTIDILISFLVSKGIPAILAISPYILLIILIFMFKKKLEKSF